VVVFSLSVKFDNDGGKGQLILDPNQRIFNDFGEVTGATEIALKRLDCTLKLVKKGKVNVGPPDFQQARFVYAIQGPKITSRLLLVTPGQPTQTATLLIKDKNDRVEYLVPLHKIIPQPCHPGCFPVGTPVVTPQGPRPIDSLRAGDVVLTVRPDGMSVPGKVQAVFVTQNRLFKVTTEAGVLLTTQTQPLCLADGKLRPAGELKSGEHIYRWQNGRRQTVRVLGVALTDRYEQVFNLVLGDSEVFVAGGFLARSKPPAGTAVSTLAEPSLAPAGKD
jgi:hypothetical protein